MDTIDVQKEVLAEEELSGHEAEPDYFQSGNELAAFLEPVFPIIGQEGDKLLGYMEEHGFLLGQKDGELYRGDLCYEQGKVHWGPYDIEDAINDVAEWNYDFIQEVEAAVSNTEDMIDFSNKKSYLNTLREDEKILDGMFDRTRYGKELEALAVKLAGELLEDMSREGGIDAAIQKMIEQIKEGKDMLPEVSPALKQNTGRSR